ncbi:hypothetical protein R3X27_12620 [Tropicimonas sp. TH_r6]|uniref:hypothetical protein n=1 Tax=Tropicimonas sp. TH_r6 TaxID=3082085 RepID=UPI002954DB7D|nr:hypothetical protein [Tropicimonas sp. TH_r6]MDV7143524.1 hypothetical protein [Tropicimonas sp. TH_r6]
MSRPLGEKNAASFRAWVAEREAEGDMYEYVHNGVLFRRAIMEELGFSRSVFTQNPDVKLLLEECDRKWGNPKTERGSQSNEAREEGAARERAVRKAHRAESANYELLERLAVLEEQNRQLRIELANLKEFAAAKEAFDETGAVLRVLDD